MASHAPAIKVPNQNKQTTTRSNKAPPIVRQVIATPGQSLEDSTRAEMEHQFNHDFSRVRIHTDERANESAEAVDALAYTVGNHVVFDENQYAPNTSTGRQTLRHELAHVVQQRGAESVSSEIALGNTSNSAEQEAAQLSKTVLHGSPYLRPAERWPITLMRQPTSLATIPLSERRAIQVSTMSVTVPPQRINAFFTLMPSGNPGEQRSVGATNSYSTNIPAALHVGLASVGAWIQGDTNALPLNSSIEVDLDLSNHGGSHATYRFTYFTHSTGHGRRARSSNVMLIELVGNVVAAPAGQAAPASTFSIGSTSFNLAGRWTNDEYAVLRQALALLPAQALTDAAGVTFRRSGSGSTAEAGIYDQATDTITLHNNAFPSSSMRIGQRSRGAYNVLHEVGHALDLRVLERAWNRFNTAGQSTAARHTLLRQRSLSGSRYVRDAGTGDYNVEQNMADTRGTFRQAARRDQITRQTGSRTTGVGTTATLQGGITDYSDTDYQELFAESFALYISAPETLRQLRPNIYNYFNSRYPRPRTP